MVTIKLNFLFKIPTFIFLLGRSGQRDHPHVGLEDGLQLPAHPRGRSAGLPGQRVWDLRLHVRPLGKPAHHRRGGQDHQGVPGGRHGGKLAARTVTNPAFPFGCTF